MRQNPAYSSTPFKPNIWAIVLAAGQGQRLKKSLNGKLKQFYIWKGFPLFWHCAEKLILSNQIEGIVFTFPKDNIDEAKKEIDRLYKENNHSFPYKIVIGGNRRQDSVRLSLESLPENVSYVLIHDAARPFITPNLVKNLCIELINGIDCIIPVIPVKDTIKRIDNEFIAETLDRDTLVAVQTPQGFSKSLLIKAHKLALEKDITVTDDASLIELLGQKVKTIFGDPKNIKITSNEDLELLADEKSITYCTGMGYDVHRYGSGRPLKLGGILIPSKFEVIAHSDGDVLLHALMDALLGCAGLGDIGKHFPDSDMKFENISSAILLDEVLQKILNENIYIQHIDMTIVAQKPKIAAYCEEIRKNIANLLKLDKKHVNLKATTEEGLGFTGNCEGIKAYASVIAIRKNDFNINSKHY